MRIRTVLTRRRTLLVAGLLAILSGVLVASAALLRVESATLATFSLTVESPPPPPPDLEGCSPGFWKQPHHLEDWPDLFSPDDTVSVVFGIEAPPDLTLLQALDEGGGGVNGLLRHAVAALLNAAHDGVNYPFSVAEVISMTQVAFPDGDIEGTKATFEAANELGCGLGEDGEDDEGDGDENGGNDGEDGDKDDNDNDDDEGTESPDSENGDNQDPDAESYEGCEAGFWENEANQEGWPDGLSPDALVSEIFGAEIADSPTLFEALSNEGDGVEALIRQATAALLNALSPEIVFGKSAVEIIELFQSAIRSADPELIAETTRQLQELNDGDCPWPSGVEDEDLTQSDSGTLDPTPTAEPEHPAPTDSPEPTATPQE